MPPTDPPRPPATGADGADGPRSADARIAALEERVADLEARLAQARVRPARTLGERVERARPPWMRWSEVRSEDVLGKAGIALLLIGVLFLLQYALDLDLLTPAVRVGGAGALGAALLALGLRLSRRGRPTLGRLLEGGGVATLYGTLWAASQLYGLIPLGAAFAGLAGVAALALVLAERERDAALSVVATLGGLLTPLLLYRGAGPVVPLAAYGALLVGAAGAVYARRGWPALAGAAALGGWGVALVAWDVGVRPEAAAAGGAERLAFTALVGAVAGVTGALPVWRALYRPAPDVPVASRRWPRLLRPEGLAVLAAPLLTLGFLDAAWSWPPAFAAALAAGGAAGYGLGVRRLLAPAPPALGASTPPVSAEARALLLGPFALAAGALAAWGAGRLLGSSDVRTLGAAVAAAAAVAALGRHEGRRDLARLGDLAALGGGLWLAAWLALSLGWPWDAVAPLRPGRFAELTTAALLGGAALALVGFRAGRGSATRAVYVTAAHLVALAWLRLALRPLGDGAALVSLGWGLYAIALLVVGLRLRDGLLRPLGLYTVLATAAKVLLFDLDAIAVPWRIALFLGLGALLLVVSYFAPHLLRLGDDDAGDDEPPPPTPPPPPPSGDGAAREVVLEATGA
ncbi:DUF2339 domain-containing protein [Rubrivirga sp. S365]|uniref:DUF2339 domain-containing protein n=1 Tax=Rubrivirga litoralis TaxID=3075598 RepID=A0ABU3BUT0_9BACT|nr:MULTISPECIES: DUF2339 domain-containing protein [unclassified Rubrivirga]MDT0632990.1 DUF2339 domain-containing protein [Rubrivirga sp. F394]MDT7857882.1 DUF2339 domain-containing protein [Rubrivirga sp. S365]